MRSVCIPFIFVILLNEMFFIVGIFINYDMDKLYVDILNLYIWSCNVDEEFINSYALGVNLYSYNVVYLFKRNIYHCRTFYRL